MTAAWNAAALVLATTGCAKVYELEPSARRVCAGEEVVFTWKIKGDPEFTVEPDTPVTGSGDRRAIRPTQNTRVTLRADRWFHRSKPASHDITVGVATSHDVTASVDDRATCDAAANKLRARANVSQFSDSIRVARVAAHPNDPHSYTVTHASKTGVVDPQQPSLAFAGTSMNGAWDLEATLISPETCGSDTITPNVPINLIVRVTSDCSGGAP